jgi:hypothetical protein
MSTPRIAGIGVKDVPLGVFEEHTDTLHFRRVHLVLCVVVDGASVGKSFRRERHVVVVIEIAAGGRQPFEAPPQTRRKGLQLRQRRMRDGDERHVALIQMWHNAVKIVGPKRAAFAAGLPIGTNKW